RGSDALGATLTLKAGERTITRDVRSAYSYLASNDPRVHVGLGDVDAAAEVTVRWTDGARETFGGFAADGVVELVRGTGTPIRE
ncbi:MAG: ASPIC/UnbV domain-containing protein, partial [Planctomycetota bacterium]|nr:ASPIC/UnbV domain-containing protein [Planctomycetota bacterium]